MGPRIRSRYPVKDPVRFHDRHSSRWDEDVPRTTGARWTEMADNERGRGPSIVAPYTYHGDCLCWLMATYVAHTSHYEAVLDPHEPLLSPWPRRRRVMANTLRIKCILSLSAWWHRCHSTIQITLTLPIPPCGSSFYPFLPSPLSACLLLRLFSSFVLFFPTIHRWIRGVSAIFHGSAMTLRDAPAGWGARNLLPRAIILFRTVKLFSPFSIRCDSNTNLRLLLSGNKGVLCATTISVTIKMRKLYYVWRKMTFNIVV